MITHRAFVVTLLAALACVINGTAAKWAVNEFRDTPLNSTDCRTAEEARNRGTLVCEMSITPRTLALDNQEIQFDEAWIEESVSRDHFLVWFPYYKRLGFNVLGVRLADEGWQVLVACRARPYLMVEGNQTKELWCLGGSSRRNDPIGVYFVRLDGQPHWPLRMYVWRDTTEERSATIVLTPKGNR
jgi:hypothetical protein